MIRSLRELTLRAACGCLSRGRAALGSNPGGFVHTRLTCRYKKGPLGALFISTGGEGGKYLISKGIRGLPDFLLPLELSKFGV